jgi:hypothetical protein
MSTSLSKYHQIKTSDFVFSSSVVLSTLSSFSSILLMRHYWFLIALILAIVSCVTAQSAASGTSVPASASSPAASSSAAASASSNASSSAASPAASGQSSQAQQQAPAQPSATPATGIQIPINPPNSAHHSIATRWTAIALLLVTCVFWHL